MVRSFSRETRKPPRLHLGDTIGVVAPSAPLLADEWEHYAAGLRILQEIGFTTREGDTLRKRRWWMAGTPADQANEINAMFRDPAVKAIVAHSGGFSALSLLDRIDYASIAAHPKPFLGMSDVTILHLAFYARCGLVGFHADAVTWGLGSSWPTLDPVRRAYLTALYRQMLTSPEPIGRIRPASVWECWRAGFARGPLIGGCLKRVTALAATPFFPPTEAFDGAILFWEEIDRDIWDLAADLTILRHRGIFKRIAGMVIGKLTWINHATDGPDFPTIRELVLEIAGPRRFPILAGVNFGHHTANVPMPIGVEAELDAGAASFALIEATVL